MSISLERIWSVGRITTAAAVLAGTQLLLAGNPAYWIFVGGTLFAIFYGSILLAVLARRRLFRVFAIGFALDNLLLVGTWWSYLHVNQGALESNDLYLVMVPVVIFEIVRVGWIAGAFLATFWLGWLSWTAIYYFPAESYDVQQLPIRLMLIGVSFVLVLRLVAIVNRERRLERARLNELAQLERLKSSVVQSISHELRTPLTSAKVYAELLRKGPGRSEGGPGARALDGLQSSLQRLEKVVEQSIEFASISDSEPAALTDIDLPALVRRSVDLMSPEFERRGQTVNIDAPSSLPMARGYASQVERALLILLDNANKYSNADGRIQIVLRSAEPILRVEVIDEGPGIPEEDRKFIFSSFFRGSQGDRLSVPGAGLGLALAKQLIERQGGEIGITSQASGGTTVFFTLQAVVHR